MKRSVFVLAVFLILLAAPVVANELNTYMGTGDVHWVWCGDSRFYNDGRLDIYPIRDWAVRIECSPPQPDLTVPVLDTAVFLPVVLQQGGR